MVYDAGVHHTQQQTFFLIVVLPFLLVRSFAKPPKQVQVICECILVMRGHKEISWKAAKGMMSEANFLRSLMEMDCDAIQHSQVKTVRGTLAPQTKLLQCLCHVM